MFKSFLSKTKNEDSLKATHSALLGSATDLSDAPLHPDADEEGGLACNNEALLKQQREAISGWIKSMGKRLLQGNLNLINTPFPVVMFEPRSYLEKLADPWVYPKYLSRAAATTDPVERFKLVVTWFVAGLHHGFEKWKKPFNPILGETWQASLSDGSSIFLEQISHHPPISAFQLQGPNNSYCFRGLSQPTVSLVVKHYGFKTMAKGYRVFDFPDGTRIEFQYPYYYIKNVVYSSKPRAEVDGTAVITDAKNGLKAVLQFGAVKGSKNKVLKRTDAVTGAIYQCASAQVTNTQLETVFSASLAAPTANDADSDDSELYESASENEWDPSKDVTDEEVAAAVAAAVAAEPASPTTREGALDNSPFPGPSLSPLRPPQLRSISTDPVQMLKQNSSKHTTHSVPNSLPESPTVGRSASQPSPANPYDLPSPQQSRSLFGGFKSMTSLIKGKSQSSNDLMSAGQPPDSVQIASITGSWLSHLSFDGVRYWQISTEKPDLWRPVDSPLPSDSRYRQDLVHLAKGDLKGAQQWKETLEHQQRHEKKLREAARGIH